MKIAGLDLSLTSTGLVDGAGEAHLIGSKQRGLDRLAELRDLILDNLAGATLVAIEGYAYGRPNQAHQLGELGGVIRLALHERDIHIANVPPSTVKLWATGKGNAPKDAVLAAAVRRWPDINDNNIADAAWLRDLAEHAYSGKDTPEIPAAKARALIAVEWPAP